MNLKTNIEENINTLDSRFINIIDLLKKEQNKFDTYTKEIDIFTKKLDC